MNTSADINRARYALSNSPPRLFSDVTGDMEMRQGTKRRQDLSAPRMIYENVLAGLSNGQNRGGDNLTSESSSGEAKEVASIKSTASMDQSTVVDSRVFLVSFIICNIIVPKEFKSADVCSSSSGKRV